MNFKSVKLNRKVITIKPIKYMIVDPYCISTLKNLAKVIMLFDNMVLFGLYKSWIPQNKNWSDDILKCSLFPRTHCKNSILIVSCCKYNVIYFNEPLIFDTLGLNVSKMAHKQFLREWKPTLFIAYLQYKKNLMCLSLLHVCANLQPAWWTNDSY